MSIPTQLVITFPSDYTPYNKIEVIKTIRILTNCGLKDAKDTSEMFGQQILPVNIMGTSGFATPTDAYFEELCRILRVNGCEVGSSVLKILQSLRDLGAEALKQGEDDLASEILQLVLAEKLRRMP